MHIDVTQQIGAGVREVRAGERDGQPVRFIIAGRTYPTAREDLWDALSSPERIPRWLMPISGELRLGGRYQLEGNAGGEITRCDPPSHLAVTWEFGGGVSWVEVRITEAPDGAHLELQHTVPVDAHWAQFGAGATGVGWDLSLMGLERHLAEGDARGPADRSDAQRWLMSDEGRDFMRRSSDAWGRAAVAAGVDAAEALAMAARTTAAYTGEGTPPADDGD